MSRPADTALANAIRFLAIDAIVRAGEGHQGVPLGMAEIATALYHDHLKFDASDPTWPDRDRVVLSNGHGSMLLYAVLHLSGYERFPIEEIRRFRELGAQAEGHPEIDPAAGIEVTTGPLGQGIANAFGMAVAEAHLAARFGPELVDHRTYAFVGDGCLQEGVGQEMISLAGHLRLGKLTLLWDDNRITDDGSTALSISEDVAERFRVAGWHVIEVDGHDAAAVSAALAATRADPRPSLLACRTVIARGLARLQGQRGGHSARLHPEDADNARRDLDWPHAPFEIPVPVRDAWRAAGHRHADTRAQWARRLATLPVAERAEFERVMAGELPAGWRDVLQNYKQRAVDVAPADAPGGIMISAEINDRLTEVLPERMVGCADLEAPTSHKRGLQAFTADDHRGAYVHCGVREHLMGAMANGMAAHGGVLPLAVTYLAFADYERPAMRMAALMGLPVKFVFSHDSIGVGKNGPTHQPVEILASLRAMPNMLVLRPADAVEAAECWEMALECGTGPATLVFARQALPGVRRTHVQENLSRRGAYVLAEAEGGEREVTLLATGSEVAIAVQARALLQAEGIPAAVVSMPCCERFDAQDDAYRAAVLKPGSVRVAIEAAVRFGWDRYLGEGGGFIGMSGFGASGPAEALYEKFGITPAAAAAEARRLLPSSRYRSGMKHIVFLDRSTIAPQVTVRAPSFAHRMTEHATTAPDEVVARLEGATVAITNKAPITAETLARLPSLRLVAVAATGTDCVDKAAAQARGVAVVNIRGYALNTVPEHAFALILALRRNLVAYRESVLRGRWQESGQFCYFDHPIRDLAGARLGIIGEGVLGQRVADIGRAFGMLPMFAAHKGKSGMGPLYTPWQEVLETSDVISIHSPLTKDTRGMLAMPEFEAMRRRPIIVNTARGGLVDERDLVRALDAGLVSGAGFDVVDGEPPALDNPLMQAASRHNVILTPHVAWASDEAQQALADQLIDNIENFMRGSPTNLVLGAY